MSTESKVIEGDKSIAVFMDAEMIAPIGHTMRAVKFPKETHGLWVHAATDLKYHSSWDWLIPACKKFDKLNLRVIKYQKLCDEIDNAVSCYEIEPAWNCLVKAITWLNTQSSDTKQSL